MKNPDYLPYLYYGVTMLTGVFLSLYLLLMRKWLYHAQLLEFFLCTFAIYVMTFTDTTASIATDRSNYVSIFESGFSTIEDKGFLLFVNICRYLFGGVVEFFFLTCSVIYVGSFWLLSNYIAGKKSFCLIVVGFISLGFLSYNLNTLRAGLSLALFLLSVVSYFDEKKNLYIVFSILTILFHFATSLIVIAFVLAVKKIEIKWYYLFWAVMLIISFLNVAQPLTNVVRIVEYEKLDLYLNAKYSDYKVGFRWDFIIYSLFPLLLGFYYVTIQKYSNPLYLKLYKAFILANAVWLIYIRIPFSDRLAYLSWFLLPFIVLTPLLDNSFYNTKRWNHIAYIIAFVCILNSII